MQFVYIYAQIHTYIFVYTGTVRSVMQSGHLEITWHIHTYIRRRMNVWINLWHVHNHRRLSTSICKFRTNCHLLDDSNVATNLMPCYTMWIYSSIFMYWALWVPVENQALICMYVFKCVVSHSVSLCLAGVLNTTVIYGYIL